MEEARKSPAGILMLLFLAAIAGAALMFKLGMGALDMSGPARELNKLLDEKTAVCSGRGKLWECEKVMKRIENLEKEIAGKNQARGMKGR